MAPIVLTVAPTGGETTREHNPNLPITPAEVAAEARRCRDAGAAIVHIHARDADGRATDDPSRIREFVDAVRAAVPDMLVNVSTAGSLEHDSGRRIAALDTGCDLASLDAGSMNFGRDVFLNPPVFLEELAAAMLERGVKPEVEVFDVGQLSNALRLYERGLLAGPLWVQFVLGVPGGIPATLDDLALLVRRLPPDARWSVIGVGRHQLAMTTIAAAAGGHVRVGFEDNPFWRKGEPAASNADFVARAARIARELERPPATPDEARAIVGLPPR